MDASWQKRHLVVSTWYNNGPVVKVKPNRMVCIVFDGFCLDIAGNTTLLQ